MIVSLPTKISAVVVDDDKDILTVLKKGLELNDFNVIAFDSPLKALQYFKTVHSPELLITDIRMPEMTGFELIRRVKKDHPELKIMALTSFEINKSEFDAVFKSSKIDALVNKPVSIHRLLNTIRAVMTGKRANVQS